MKYKFGFIQNLINNLRVKFNFDFDNKFHKTSVTVSDKHAFINSREIKPKIVSPWILIQDFNPGMTLNFWC